MHQQSSRSRISFHAEPAALIVEPAEPYFAWARSLPDAHLTPAPTSEKTVYLVSVYDDETEAASILRSRFAEVFAHQLFGWHTNEAGWPKDRSLAAFKKWFNVEMHGAVEDLGDEPLEDE